MCVHFGTLTPLSVHLASPVLLSKNGPFAFELNPTFEPELLQTSAFVGSVTVTPTS
jgi:hypothetical protein